MATASNPRTRRTSTALTLFPLAPSLQNYVLCVKLGTITPKGADVFSYAPDEDDMVIDPLLGEHLAHLGIDVMKMEKTAKTMAEMNIDLNLNYDFNQVRDSR